MAAQLDDFPAPLDPHARQLLELARQAGYPPFEALSPEKARRAYAATCGATQTPGGDVASVREQTIAGPGGPLRLRIYRGLGTQNHEDLPCLLFLHGGGWVIGGLDTHDGLCRKLANLARLCVVSVDYRLAPEHPFPAACDDAAAALRWVAAHARELRIGAQAVGVGGDSAGGNLAAMLALRARDGSAPALCHQLLLYPVLDLAADSASYRRVTGGVPLTAATMHWFIGHYTPEPAARQDWRASPLRAPSLAGAPPAFILTVAHDPLCDEGIAYARRLGEAGVRVTALHCNDQMHGVLDQARYIPMADVLIAQAAAALGHELHRAAEGARP